MLSILLRRLLWLIPTLFVVSLIVFFIFSFLPQRTDDEDSGIRLGLQGAEEQRRERFVQLPIFLNADPKDVRARASAAALEVADDGAEAERGAREIARLGGAALPHLIPTLDRFDPVRRSRVALALAPVAIRMNLPNRQDTIDPDRAADFWVRFWADRSVEFRAATVRTAVERLARYRTSSRATEIEQLDTFALPALLERLEPPTDAASFEVARALTDALSHATNRDDRIPETADLAEARLVVARWRKFWLVYESDFVTYDGLARTSAALRETRYAKWAAQVVLTLTFPDEETSRNIGSVTRAIPITLGLVFGGIAFAYVVGTLLGIASSIGKHPLPKVVVGVAVVILHALPAATLAVVFLTLTPAGHNLASGILVVGLGMLASPARHQRDLLTSSYLHELIRASQARGAGHARALITQGLRQSLLATMAVASVEPPAALGAAFMVEQVFDLPGLGRLTVAAVLDRDVSFIMGLVLGAVLIAGLLLLVSDLIQSGLDPRLRGRLGRVSS